MEPMLCIFHRLLGSNEEGANEEEVLNRIIYFYPQSTPSSYQLERLQFCEGIIDFTAKFSDEGSNVETMETEGYIYTFLEVESSIWIIMSMTKESAFCNGTFTYSVEGMLSVLRNLYDTFCLFYGKISYHLKKKIKEKQTGMDIMESIQQHLKRMRKLEERINLEEHEEKIANMIFENSKLGEELEELRFLSPIPKLKIFFDVFIPTYISLIDFSNIHLFNDLDGFHFYPVNKHEYLQIQNFTSSLILKFPHLLKNISFIYEGHLIWSSMEKDTLMLLYRFYRLREQAFYREKHEIYRPCEEINQDESCIWYDNRNLQDEDAKSQADQYIPVWGNKKKPNFEEDSIPILRSLQRLDSNALKALNHEILSASTATLRKKNKSDKETFETRSKLFGGFMMKSNMFQHQNQESVSDVSPTFYEALWCPYIHSTREDTNDEEQERSRVLVYHKYGITLLFTVSCLEEKQNHEMLDAVDEYKEKYWILDFCHKIENEMNSNKLWRLSHSIHQQFVKTLTPSLLSSSSALAACRFMYYNHVNKALKLIRLSSQVTSGRRESEENRLPIPTHELPFQISIGFLEWMNSLHKLLRRDNSIEDIYAVDECGMQYSNDSWWIAKRFNERLLFLQIDEKVANVESLQETLDELFRQYFGNVLFH